MTVRAGVRRTEEEMDTVDRCDCEGRCEKDRGRDGHSGQMRAGVKRTEEEMDTVDRCDCEGRCEKDRGRDGHSGQV